MIDTTSLAYSGVRANVHTPFGVVFASDAHFSILVSPSVNG